MTLNEVADRILEAVKIDGFDREDAKKVLQTVKAMEGANPKELNELRNQVKELYKRNWAAMKSYNARWLADKKSQEKKNDKNK